MWQKVVILAPLAVGLGVCFTSPTTSSLFYSDRALSAVNFCLFRLCRNIKGIGEPAKPSKQEIRRAEAAIKRQKMLEEQQREKDKVKDRLDLIRQMKGNKMFLLNRSSNVQRAGVMACTDSSKS